MASFVPASGVLVARRYLLRACIGRGGMGEVWEAEDRELEGPCAVKFILNGMLPERDARSRFTREAKVAARLRSPHAVQILGVGEHEGSPYLAMELLEGETLQSVLTRIPRLDAETTLGVVSQIAAVLEKARELDIVHRDLKPDNVWLCAQRDLFVKVFDFGIAKTRLATLQTISGAVVGTPHYMSPEQVQGGRSVDYRTDLWALAILTVECLTGQRPFESEALGGLVLKIMAGPGADLRELTSSVSPGFGVWAARALAVEPAQRFQSASELVDALRSQLVPGSRGPSGTQILHSLPRVPAPIPTPAGARTPLAASSEAGQSQSAAVAATSLSEPAAGVPAAGAASERPAPASRTEPIPPVARSQHGSGRGARWRVAGAVAVVLVLAALVLGLVRRFPSGTDEPEVQALPAAVPSPAASAAPAPGAPGSISAEALTPPSSVDGERPGANAPAAKVSTASTTSLPTADVSLPKPTRPPAAAAVHPVTKPSQVRAGLRPAPAPTSASASASAPAPAKARPEQAAPSTSSYATNPGF